MEGKAVVGFFFSVGQVVGKAGQIWAELATWGPARGGVGEPASAPGNSIHDAELPTRIPAVSSAIGGVEAPPLRPISGPHLKCLPPVWYGPE